VSSDSEAIARSLKRASAFEAIFERHFTAVYRYLRLHAGTAAAEDLAAETFARAFSSRRSYDLSYDDARPWLLGIATDVLRADGRVAAPQPEIPEDDNAERAAYYRGWTVLRRRIRSGRRLLRYLWLLVPVAAAIAVIVAIVAGH
jgi:DNA-directed RNA polymerase specialized sigma24 family protein